MAKSTLEPQKIKLRESFASLKTIPRFFREIRKVNPHLFYANILARLISAFLPLALLFVAKLIVDEVLVQLDLEEKVFERLWSLIAIEFALAIGSDLLRRAISYTDALLGDQYSIRSSVSIIRKTSEIRLADLEDADFYDKMERARRQTTGRVALMSNVLTQGEDLIVIISLLAGVVAFEPWLIILLILSVVPTILNEIKFSGTGYSLARSWTQERRELDYLRYAGASDLTAKEVKLFGLTGYIADRFQKLSDIYYLASKKLAKQRARWGSFFNLIGTGSYYGAYVIIVYRTAMGI
ncbi:MAG: ABC transporter ATP-binding protein, partial [Croceimicrobium sp.]